MAKLTNDNLSLGNYHAISGVNGFDLNHEWLELNGELFYRSKVLHDGSGKLWRKHNALHLNFTLLYEEEGRHQEWRVNGKLHRIGGPAYVHYEDERWYKNGVLHREDGPAFINNAGDKMLYIEGKLHRDDGPVIEFSNGNESWYRHGLLHNEHGPAKIGTKRVEFFLNGSRVKGHFSRGEMMMKRAP